MEINKLTKGQLEAMERVKEYPVEVLSCCSKAQQFRELCLEAVKVDGNALPFVKQQTEEICLAAVRQNPSSLRFVKKQTEEICLAAVWVLDLLC